MYLQIAHDLINLAIDQPTPIQPPGGEKIMTLVGMFFWGITISAIVGVAAGGAVMWYDHADGRGATGGKGVKIVIGALIGTAVFGSAAALVTFML